MRRCRRYGLETASNEASGRNSVLWRAAGMGLCVCKPYGDSAQYDDLELLLDNELTKVGNACVLLLRGGQDV